MATLGVILGALVNAALIALFARRLMAVPVGWPRTLVLSLIVNAAAPPLLSWASSQLGVSDLPASASERASAVLLVVLLIAWLIATEIGVLAILEALVPTGSVPGPVELVRSLPGRWRRGRRYTQIVAIAGRHGLGRYLTPRRADGDVSSATTASALRAALTDGGVTFVKLGQMLSTRPDLLGPEYIRELSRLHADVPAEPWPVVAATLTQELGAPPERVFAAIDTEPLAAASVGQVYRARLHGGEEVVVKVQRSDARSQVTGDLDIVLRLARWLQRTAPWARALGVGRLATGFADSLHEELDYRVEADNVAGVRAALPEGSPVRVPRAYADLCTRRVLVMEAMSGRPLSSAGEKLHGLDPEARTRLAGELLGIVLDQVLESGIFHADLHAGNVLLDDNGRLSLLDFGSVGRLDRGARTSLGLLLFGVDRQDAAAVTQALTDLLDPGSGLDDRGLERDLGQLVMRYGHSSGQVGEMFVQLLRVVLAHGLSVPPPVAAAFRALGALEGTLTLLDPDFDLATTARERGQSVAARQLAPGALRDELTDQLITLMPMAQRLPRRISSIVEDLDSGDFRVTVRAFQDPEERSFLTNLMQQLVISLLSATTAICGVLLVIWGRGPTLVGTLTLTTYLGLVLLLFAFVLGCRVAVLVFRSRGPGG